MSLRERRRAATDLSFPRVSGDEPILKRQCGDLGWFSPRERG